MINFLKGRKTYIIAGLTVLYAVLSVYFHQMTIKEAIVYVLGGSGLATLRAAVGKIEAILN